LALQLWWSVIARVKPEGMLFRIVALKEKAPTASSGSDWRFERAANAICGACPYWKNPHD
jgi:hypothetical protein